MKKNVFSLLLAVCLMLTLSACGKKNESETMLAETTQTLPMETETAETTVETMGPIGLGRVDADSESNETESATEEITESSSTTPDETNTTETRPVETRPMETKPVEAPSFNGNSDFGGGRVN